MTFRAGLAGMVLAVFMVASTACGGYVVQVPDVPGLPPQVEGVPNLVYAAKAKALGILTSGARLMVLIDGIEEQAHTAGVIPEPVHDRYVGMIREYVLRSNASVERIMTLDPTAIVETWEELQGVLQPVVDSVNQIAAFVQDIGAIQTRAGEIMAAVKDIVINGLGQLIGSNLQPAEG